MKFSPGDKVSFINEKQEGVVVKILDNNKVVVDIEDGFELTVSEKELVKTGVVGHQTKETPVVSDKPQPSETGDLVSIGDHNTALIAALPKATGTVLTGAVVYYLINRTSYDLIFSLYAHQDQNWNGVKYGVVKTGEFLELAEYSRDALIDISSFLFQGSLFVSSGENFPLTTRKEFGVLLPGLQNARAEIKGLAAFASQVTVISDIPLEETDVELKDLEAKYRDDKKLPTRKSFKQYSSPSRQDSRYGILENEKEIDLHIEELVNDFSGLSNAEMVTIQLKRFSKEMDAAIANHLKKVIFIHGVGNGKLKNEIRKELRNYSGVAFRDADNRKYGQGATEVIFE